MSFDDVLNVYDLSGTQVVQHSAAFFNSASIELSLTPGIYTADLSDEKAIKRTKLVME